MNARATPSTVAADEGVALAEGFARRIGALARRLQSDPHGVRWAERAAFAVSRATAQGHVCVSLAALAERYGESVAAARAALLASGVGCDGERAAADLLPLVIDEGQRVYLARYFDYERRLAQALVARSGHEAVPRVRSMPGTASALRERIARFFGAPKDDDIDWQRVAALVALSGRLTIVSGGPGTGKTTTVVGVLACLLDENPTLRIALAAPTGKAAQRMQEALIERADALPPELAARLPRTSFTLQRLLGTQANGRFRHHRDNPLPYDVIVVDEASMIDVALAAHLLEAVAPDARLVMLGDKDQLAAVEAGAVFAELSARPVFSEAGAARIAARCPLRRLGSMAALPREADEEAEPSAGSAAQEADSDYLLIDDSEGYAALHHEAMHEPWHPAAACRGRQAGGQPADRLRRLARAQLPLRAGFGYRHGCRSRSGAVRRRAALAIVARKAGRGDERAPIERGGSHRRHAAPSALRAHARAADRRFRALRRSARRRARRQVRTPPRCSTRSTAFACCARRGEGARGVDEINARVAAKVARARRAPRSRSARSGSRDGR